MTNRKVGLFGRYSSILFFFFLFSHRFPSGCRQKRIGDHHTGGRLEFWWPNIGKLFVNLVVGLFDLWPFPISHLVKSPSARTTFRQLAFLMSAFSKEGNRLPAVQIFAHLFQEAFV